MLRKKIKNMKTVFASALIILIVSNVVIAIEEDLLHSVQDDVAGDSYKYYSLMYEGVVKIQLISETGDADIYVSQITAKPTYESNNYCLQSTTCGEDIIYIPQSFKRPVSIGVYGHPSHENSRFTLSVFQILLSEGENFNEQSPTEIIRKKRLSKKETPSVIITFLWTLIDVLLQLLF
ncbi:UPF0669 protein C6orf120 homolog [Leptopilina boulardi]|uniref:UPF0669 protein C6orf120 homolog n=1 Tax=Leptopilina boulardi TaxID=63433 RepID=UPI0021F5C0F4|nr:UPF0669 protein C6orf120 homolog [Leptopilina boulardi]